ncbi:retrovirus-related pol polyprotein from transposon TNT 1-94 [Tanacetum coccineum]
MFKDLKKFQAELDRYHDVNYESKMEIDCAKAKGDLISVKPEYLKKAQRANPRLYDIGCYNDNLSLMLAPESDETIRLAQESRSKLSDLIKPFDYKNLNNLYDLFVPQHEKSTEQRYFSKREYYYADHMNPILGVYTTLDEFTDLQCDYVDQQSQEQLNNDKVWKQKESNSFRELNVKYFEIQDLKAQLQDKDIAIRVIPTTSVSRPQLKSNQMEDTVMHNNNQGKKQQVEDHHRNFKFSKQKMSVTACNDSLNAKNLNVNFVCVTCGKCVLNDSYDASMPLGTKSRTTNISEPTTLRKSTVSNTPLSSNYFAARRDNFIHLRLWMLKAHYRKSQASKFKKISVSKRVYYVKGLNYKLFSVGQFCDANLEVAFRKSTCYIRDLKGNDLLTGSCGIDLYSITLQDTYTLNPICLMAKATSSQSWLWHHRLSHLNFDTINLLLKYDILTGLPRLKFIKYHLCSSCELGKAKCTEFLNKTLHAYFAQEGIEHQMSTARTPEQNGVVERRNRTLVEAAQTMLSADKVPLFFWAEAFATS